MSKTFRDISKVLKGMIILFDNYSLTLPAATVLRVWVAGWMGGTNTINEPTGSNNRQFSARVMEIYPKILI